MGHRYKMYVTQIIQCILVRNPIENVLRGVRSAKYVRPPNNICQRGCGGENSILPKYQYSQLKFRLRNSCNEIRYYIVVLCE